MNYVTTGKIYERGPITEGVSERGNVWQRMTLVLDVPLGNYSKKMAFNVSTGNIPGVMALHEGDRVTVDWDVTSREWTNKEGVRSWFTSIELRSIRLADEPGQQAAQPATAPMPGAGAPQDNDLPF